MSDREEQREGLLPVERRTYMTIFAAGSGVAGGATSTAAGTAPSEGGATSTGGDVTPANTGYGEGGYGEGPYGGPVGPPPLRDEWDAPTSIADDDLYRDINGDEGFDILDVQGFFEELDNEVVRNNVFAFDFDGDGRISIFDVQALFQDLGSIDT